MDQHSHDDNETEEEADLEADFSEVDSKLPSVNGDAELEVDADESSRESQFATQETMDEQEQPDEILPLDPILPQPFPAIRPSLIKSLSTPMDVASPAATTVTATASPSASRSPSPSPSPSHLPSLASLSSSPSSSRSNSPGPSQEYTETTAYLQQLRREYRRVERQVVRYARELKRKKQDRPKGKTKTTKSETPSKRRRRL